MAAARRFAAGGARVMLGAIRRPRGGTSSYPAFQRGTPSKPGLSVSRRWPVPSAFMT
ncbi:MAG: hypothetical protein ACQSGP_23250 [Frankia sp.]